MLCVFSMNPVISMRDVAKAAGVSKATVSMVLSGKGSAYRISPATQSHVHAIANQLEYVPGPLIRYRPAEIPVTPPSIPEPTPIPPSSVTPMVEAESPPQNPEPVSEAVDPIIMQPSASDPTPPALDPIPLEGEVYPSRDPSPATEPSQTPPAVSLPDPLPSAYATEAEPETSRHQ